MTQTDVKGELDKPRRGLLIGIAAAAVVIAIGALILFQVIDDAPVTADQPVTETEIAASFLAAYGSFDADLAASYLADDVLHREFNGLEGLRLDTRFWEAVGFKLLLDSCEEQTSTRPASDGVLVRCSYDYHALRSDEIGRGPYSGSYYNFRILDGKIVASASAFEFMENRFSAEMWEPFAVWVAETHPEDGAIMYADWPNQGLDARTEASIPLWEQSTKEYVEVVNEGS